MQKDFKVYTVEAVVTAIQKKKTKFRRHYVKIKGVILDQDDLEKEALAESAEQQLLKAYTSVMNSTVASYKIDITSIELANKDFIFHTKIS